MPVGYLRVSWVDLQLDALLAAGVDPRQLHVGQASDARDEPAPPR